MQKLKKWLKRNRLIWSLLVNAAGWIVSVATSIVLSPSYVFGDEGGILSWIRNLPIFYVAGIVGLFYILAAWLSKKEHLIFWIILTVLFFGAAVWSTLRFNSLADNLTCPCTKQKVIKGSSFKDEEIMQNDYPKGFYCSDLCEKFIETTTGKVRPDLVWTDNSINDNRWTLIYAYLLIFPFVAIAIISICQAIFCHDRKPPVLLKR